MEFRYDFYEKLDLTKFKKQGAHYIGSMRELTYNFFLPEFKVVAEIITPDNSSGHLVTVYFFELVRAKDRTIEAEKAVIPLIDTRFKEIKDIQSLFKIDHYKANFDSNNAKDTVDKLCNLVRLVFKINSLKAFL
jgi:hypothetical protein